MYYMSANIKVNIRMIIYKFYNHEKYNTQFITNNTLNYIKKALDHPDHPT